VLKWLLVSTLIFVMSSALAMALVPLTPEKTPLLIAVELVSLAVGFWIVYHEGASRIGRLVGRR